MDLYEKFEKGKVTHTYQRVDPGYKTDIFVGYNDDGMMSMVITENGKEERVKSSKLIEVNIKRREDKKLALSFDLIDSAYASMFTVFCKDMIISCERANKEMAVTTALLRWKYWRELFGRKLSQILDKQEIKGLIGELFALKNRFIPEYGLRKAVKSWMGPLQGHKDVEIDDTWYEIKTINDGAVQLIISSLEQLESEVEGHLIVVRVDETSESYKNAINLNKMVLLIIDMIEDSEILEEFQTKLDNAGYCANEEYDRFNFVFKGIETYTVNEAFPRLRREEINSAIGNAKYTIMITGLSEFKED